MVVNSFVDLQPYNNISYKGMTWYEFNCKVCYNSEEIGMYFPDYYDHFPDQMPDWTIEVICCECREAPK